MATAVDTPPEGALRLRLLERRDRDEALAALRPRSRDNLFLLDLVDRIGRSSRRAQGVEVEPAVLGVWEEGRFVGAASLRPTVAFSVGLSGRALALAIEAVSRLASGLIRSEPAQVEALWRGLAEAGRRALVDRRERVLCVDRDAALPAPPVTAGIDVREAHLADLDALVDAARASLREEGRPDPYLSDPHGFRRWVRNRLPRALVAEDAGRVSFVGYSDVMLTEGWLLQGVYTWPAFRRRGIGQVGVAALCRRAFAAGAEHVQLSVVEGNEQAFRLYERLGFTPSGELRTLLFAPPER